MSVGGLISKALSNNIEIETKDKIEIALIIFLLTLGILLTLATSIIVSLIGYYHKGVFKVNLRMYLFWALIALILGELGAIYLIKDLELKRKVMIGYHL